MRVRNRNETRENTTTGNDDDDGKMLGRSAMGAPTGFAVMPMRASTSIRPNYGVPTGMTNDDITREADEASGHMTSGSGMLTGWTSAKGTGRGEESSSEESSSDDDGDRTTDDDDDDDESESMSVELPNAFFFLGEQATVQPHVLLCVPDKEEDKKPITATVGKTYRLKYDYIRCIVRPSPYGTDPRDISIARAGKSWFPEEEGQMMYCDVDAAITFGIYVDEWSDNRVGRWNVKEINVRTWFENECIKGDLLRMNDEDSVLSVRVNRDKYENFNEIVTMVYDPDAVTDGQTSIEAVTFFEDQGGDDPAPTTWTYPLTVALPNVFSFQENTTEAEWIIHCDVPLQNVIVEYEDQVHAMKYENVTCNVHPLAGSGGVSRWTGSTVHAKVRFKIQPGETPRATWKVVEFGVIQQATPMQNSREGPIIVRTYADVLQPMARKEETGLHTRTWAEGKKRPHWSIIFPRYLRASPHQYYAGVNRVFVLKGSRVKAKVQAFWYNADTNQNTSNFLLEHDRTVVFVTGRDMHILTEPSFGAGNKGQADEDVTRGEDSSRTDTKKLKTVADPLGTRAVARGLAADPLGNFRDMRDALAGDTMTGPRAAIDRMLLAEI